MPSTISKKPAVKRTGRPKTPGLADKKRCWHRYDEATLKKLQEVKEALLANVPVLFHGSVDDSSVIAALIEKAHVDCMNGNIADYMVVAPAKSGS